MQLGSHHAQGTTVAASRGQSSLATLRTALAVAAGLLVASGVFVAVQPAYAGLYDIAKFGADLITGSGAGRVLNAVGGGGGEAASNSIAISIASTFNIFTDWAGQLLLILVDWLIRIAQYNDFVNSAPVANGWSIVRDVTNMFFILALLVIAFGTILGVDAYSYKNKMLSRLLIMAVVVNFSRTICGLLIDFAQVVMLTFVYGFKEAAGGNFVDMLRITRVMQASGDSSSKPTSWPIAIAMILAFFMVLISMCVIALMVITLTIRIVYLWLLIVLSPLAFFLKAVPGGSASGYYGMWWKMFTGQVIVGPVLAFFLWLSLVTVASNGLTSIGGSGGGSQGQVSGEISKAFNSDEIGAFIMGICLLMGGLQLSKQISAESAGAAPGLAKKALSAGKWASKKAVVGADRLTGGAIATSGVPVVGRWAGDARLARAQEKRQKDTRAAALTETFSAKKQRAVANEFAFTEQGRAEKSAAQRARLKEAATNPPTDAKDLGEVHQWRKDLRKTAEKAEAKRPGSGAAILKDLGDFENKRPSLIIDKNEKDPKERARQEQSFRKSASGFSAARMTDMDASELTDRFKAFANPKALLKAQETASGDQLDKLRLKDAKGNVIENESGVRAWQDGVKARPENFGLLSEGERADLVRGLASDPARRKDVLGRLGASDGVRPDHLQGEVLNALADTGALAGNSKIADKVLAGLDYTKLRGDTYLAQKMRQELAAGISSSALGKLPEDLATQLRPLVAERQGAAAALAGGASLGQAFKGYDDTKGNFTDAGGRANFEAFLKADKANAAAVPVDAITKNGGMNDVSMSIVSNVSMGDVNTMVDGGKTDQAAAVLDVADKLSQMAGMSGDQITDAIKNSGLSASLDEVKQAIEHATGIMEDVKRGTNPLDAEMRAEKIQNKVAAAEERTAERLGRTERRITGRKRGKK